MLASQPGNSAVLSHQLGFSLPPLTHLSCPGPTPHSELFTHLPGSPSWGVAPRSAPAATGVLVPGEPHASVAHFCKGSEACHKQPQTKTLPVTSSAWAEKRQQKCTGARFYLHGFPTGGEFGGTAETARGVFSIRLNLYTILIPSFMSPGSGVPAWSRSHHALVRQRLLIQTLIQRLKKSRWRPSLGKPGRQGGRS